MAAEQVAPAGDTDLGRALGVVFRAWVRSANAVMNDLPGGARGYHVLAAAVADRAGSQAGLAQELGIDRTVMTYLVDDLERAGLLQRRADPADRRNRRLVATDAGTASWHAAGRRLRSAEEHVLGGLPEADRGTLRRLLAQLADALGDHDPFEQACLAAAAVDPEGTRAGAVRA